MKKTILWLLTLVLLFNGLVFSVSAEKMPEYQENDRQMERLNRGLIAVKTSVAPSNSVPYKGDFMNFYMPEGVRGQFVKVVAEGNSISGWNSIAEIEVYGTK